MGKIEEKRDCRTCQYSFSCSIAKANNHRRFCEHYEELKTTCKTCVHKDKCIFVIFSKENYYCEHYKDKLTRFELLKQWVEQEDKQSIAEMLAILCHEDEANDWDKYVQEFVDYLNEEVEEC